MFYIHAFFTLKNECHDFNQTMILNLKVNMKFKFSDFCFNASKVTQKKQSEKELSLCHRMHLSLSLSRPPSFLPSPQIYEKLQGWNLQMVAF